MQTLPILTKRMVSLRKKKTKRTNLKKRKIRKLKRYQRTKTRIRRHLKPLQQWMRRQEPQRGMVKERKVRRQVQNRILQSLCQKMTKQNNRVCTLLLVHQGDKCPTSMAKITCIKELSLKHSQRAPQLVQPLFMQVLLHPVRYCRCKSGFRGQVARASGLSAPSHAASASNSRISVEAVRRKVWENVSSVLRGSKSCKKHLKGTSETVVKKRGNNHHYYAFERAFQCFAAMASVCCPMNVTQDFLIDSGAGGTLISQKDIPEQWIPHHGEAPEKAEVFYWGWGSK